MAKEICKDNELQCKDLHEIKKVPPVSIKLSNSFTVLDVSASLQSLINIAKINKNHSIKLKDIVGCPLKKLGGFLNQGFLDDKRLIEVLPINSSLKSPISLKDNNELIFQWHLMQLSNTGELNLFGYDVTIENLLLRQIDALSKIISLIPGSFYWKDIKGRYLGCNENVWKMARLSSMKEIIGKTDKELVWAYLADEWIKHDEWVLKENKPLSFQESVVLSSGEKTIHTVIKLPLHDSHGKVIGILGSSLDITEQKKIQNKLKELNKLKSQFIENMQHDLRTPASGVVQALSFLCEKKYDTETLEILKLALGSGEELMVLLNQIVESEETDYSTPMLDQPIDLKKIFESVHRVNASIASIKHLQLRHRVDSKIPKVVLSDKYRIDRILLNLVGNAVKFTQKGEVFFEAKLTKQDGRNLLIEFIVKDTGIGIPDDKRRVIFERFVRLDPSNRGIYKGIGLGLTNVREYVRDLEGEFRPIESEEGKGTTFAILIPMKASLDQDMPPPSAQEKSQKEIDFFHSPDKKTKKSEPSAEEKQTKVKVSKPQAMKPATKTSVLLVEDSLVAQHMAKTVIVGLNCDVDVAGTAEDALKMIDEKHYDLIFADIGLPGMDGIEMTRHIRYNERKQGKRPTPIVGQSANADASNKKACIEAGMQDLFPKPLSTKIVTDMLQNYTAQGATSTPKPFAIPTIKNKQVIDWDIFNSIWSNKANASAVFLESKLTTFADIEEFKLAYKGKNWKQLVFFAHKMRGAFVYFGASRLEEAFSYLEAYLNDTKEPDLKIIKSLYDTVLVELRSALDEIEKLK